MSKKRLKAGSGELKIGLDARRIGRDPSGIGRYTLNLLRGLSLVGPPWRVTVFISSMSDIPGDLASAPLFDFVEMTRRPLTLSNQVTMPFTLRRLGIDVLHCLDAFAPLASGCRKIITLYDLIPLTRRHLLYAGAKARFAPLWKAWLEWQCHRASSVVTLSEHSAGDINRLLNVPLEKIRIIPASVYRAADVFMFPSLYEGFGLPPLEAMS